LLFGDGIIYAMQKKEIKTYINKDVFKTIQKARKKYLSAIIKYEGPIEAPINKNDIVGTLKIYYKDNLIEEHNLLAYESVKKQNILSRLINSINYLIWGDV